MGFKGSISMGNLMNRFTDDFANTLQAYISKNPLLNDGANTGGTQQIVTGTSGTLHGTFNFAPASGWAYVLKTMNHNENQQGTFGTLVLNNIKLNENNLGTKGNVIFSTLFGEDLTLYNNLSFEYKVNTGTGVVGTYSVDCEISGWRFLTVD